MDIEGAIFGTYGRDHVRRVLRAASRVVWAAQGMRFCANPAVAQIQSVTAITFALVIYSVIMLLLTDAWKRKKSPTDKV